MVRLGLGTVGQTPKAGDGRADLLVDVPYYDLGPSKTPGRLYLVPGPGWGFHPLSEAQPVIDGEVWTATGLGDMDGDGFSDIAVALRLGEGDLVERHTLVFRGPVTALRSPADADVVLTDGDGDGFMATSLTAVGDVDGDGHGDLLVSNSDSDDDMWTGAFLLRGPLAGTVSLADAAARFDGESIGESLAYAPAAGGDIDGDGYADLVMGLAGTELGGEGAGAVCVVYGPVSGDVQLEDADAFLVGEYFHDGAWVSAVGDVDGDGRDDVIVGAKDHSEDSTYEGAAYVVYGPVYGTFRLGLSDARVRGRWAYDRIGDTVAVGDFDADGYADLLLGSQRAIGPSGLVTSGSGFVVYGPLAGEVSLGDAHTSLEGVAAYENAGYAVAAPGDMDGDGYPDLAMTANTHDEADGLDNAGAAYVLRGGPVPRPDADGDGWEPGYGDCDDTDPDVYGRAVERVDGVDQDCDGRVDDIELGRGPALRTGLAAGDGAGSALAMGGDLDGDGWDDLVVGVPGDDAGGADAGAVYVLSGPVVGEGDLSSAVAFPSHAFSLAGGADVDGDGRPDLVVGASNAGYGSLGGGAAYLYRGAWTGVRAPGAADATLTGSVSDANAGCGVATGDLDGDGLADIVVGAPGNAYYGDDPGEVHVVYSRF